ncbi:MAG TPA: efflux RND transporter periplasmic adaptor subunit, partial [Chitinophagaceae bacterium]|nr:efflux RND transporter periplasmic adaptor subunit [Chitinophagaceae bacterium]
MLSINRSLFFFLFIITTIFFFSCGNKKQQQQRKKDPPPVVDVIIAKTKTISNTLEANGTVLANESVELHPEATGRLIYLNIPEGSFVTKGTALARVNDADLRAQLNKSKAQLELYQQNEERLRKLLEINGVNQADYDAALNLVSSTKADVAYTEALIDKTIVRAPFDGVIGLRQVSPGAYVSPLTIIATLQQTSELKIDFTLPEEYSNIIKTGNPVDVEIDAASQIHRKAVIIATEPQINQNTRNIKVRAILQKGRGNPGAFVKVFVHSGRNNNAIMVPTNCIIPNDINKQLIVVRNGKANFTDVETGIRDSANVEIVKGINPGDTIVVTGVL